MSENNVPPAIPTYDLLIAACRNAGEEHIAQMCEKLKQKDNTISNAEMHPHSSVIAHALTFAQRLGAVFAPARSVECVLCDHTPRETIDLAHVGPSMQSRSVIDLDDTSWEKPPGLMILGPQGVTLAP